MSRSYNLNKPLRKKKYKEDWGHMEWLLDDSLIKGVKLSVATMTLRKGQTSPLHRHPNCGEFLQITQGTVEVSMNGKKIVLHAGDSVYKAAGTVHNLKNLGREDAKMIVSYPTGKRIYDPVAPKKTRYKKLIEPRTARIEVRA